MPTVEAISPSFTDKILKANELVRLNPHSNNIEYIRNQILYLNDNNDFHSVPVNTHTNQITEYLLKFLIAYGKPVHLRSSHPYRLFKFSDYLKKQLSTCNSHRVLPICIEQSNGVIDYIKSKIKYNLSARWAKTKNKYELTDRPNTAFVIVEDINLDEQSYPSPCAPIKSLCDYSRLRGEPVAECSVLLLSQRNVEAMQIQSMSYLVHEDCQLHTIANIFNVSAEAFKPNGTSIFEFLCVTKRMRDLLDSLKQYSLKGEVNKNLVHLDRFAGGENMEFVGTATYLKKLVEEKNTAEVEYYKFLKG